MEGEKKTWFWIVVLLIIIGAVLYFFYNLPQIECNLYCGYTGNLQRFEKTCYGNPTCIYDLCERYGGKIVRDIFGNPYCCFCIT